MDKIFNRSPLFYMGDKYKLLPEITPHFPADINRFIELNLNQTSLINSINNKLSNG